jgi:predicted transposase YdaD
MGGVIRLWEQPTGDVMQQSPLYQEWQEEAELRGRQEERRSLALKMLQAGYPLAKIARLTGFSNAQLKRLRDEG